MPYNACFSRFNYQTKKLINYSKYVLGEVIEERNDKDLAQFIMEHIIIRAVSNFEELIMSIVFHSAINQTDKVIKFFRKSNKKSDRERIEKIKLLGHYGHLAQTHVSFKNNAKNLKKIFEYLFEFSLFDNEDNERIILDLIRVRNLIIHNGSWPQERHAKKIKTPGILIEAKKIKNTNGEIISISYKLELLKNTFMKDTFKAILAVNNHIIDNLRANA